MADLARELARHPRFRWGPGMKIADYGPGSRYYWQDETHLHGAADEGGAWMRLPKSRIGDGAYLPDLTDAATAGVLLDEVYRLHTATVVDRAETGDTPWCVELLAVGPDARDLPFRGATLGEAAARALLAWWSA